MLAQIVQITSEMWPGIEWTSRSVDEILWIGGRAENGREAQRGLPLRDLLKNSAQQAATTLSIACQEISDELQPTFIDWTGVGCA